ncbi:hypothetical protein [Anaeromicropila populeti]|uniref:Uncharacterized protein n=1 Tax=Anaeromicropila populeti TaxID=37658 RepID=A0A1I6JFB1_9FIRM|nr:hypothetical protein [Anaeromicropila populeti]SFR77554.1 hypothetical protein SAMN05661086_01628 [Anaeromicropila populeti]
MILTDHFGKKVNAEHFTLEVSKGFIEGESGLQTIISLQGTHHYFKEAPNGEIGIVKDKRALLERMTCNDKNINLLLDRKEQLNKEVTAIKRELKLAIGTPLQYGPCEYLKKEQSWLIENGYRFREEDEFDFHKWNTEPEQEPEP